MSAKYFQIGRMADFSTCWRLLLGQLQMKKINNKTDQQDNICIKNINETPEIS